MIFNNIKYHQKIAAFTLIFYLVLSAFSAFHYHKTILNNEINFSKYEEVQKDLFKDENLCKLYSFSSSQISNLYFNQFSYSPEVENIILTSTHFNIYSIFSKNSSKRGPPNLI